MNLVEGLLKADQEKAKEYATRKFLSKRLAVVLGQDEPVEITIREVEIETIKNVQQFTTRRDGTMDSSKAFDANLILCAKGIVDPDLNNPELQKHFGASSAMDLAEILFRFEAAYIADAITKLSNMSRADVEEIIKN